MCSISASFSYNKLIELCKINEYRGCHSHSITYFNSRLDLVSCHRKLGPINYDNLKFSENLYCIVHQQAPTTDARDESSIHPAEYDDSLLWHNGILKPSTIKTMQEGLQETSQWDSYLFCRYLSENLGPEDIDGSFACVLYEKMKSGREPFSAGGGITGLYLFRNELAPLFVDKELNISSTKFRGGLPIKAGVMFGFNPFEDQMIDLNLHFSTVNNPYAM